MARQRKPRRKRIGRVSYYRHHGAWWVYHREGSRAIRRRVAGDEESAARVAAQVNAQLAAGAPTLMAFEPVSVPELRQRFFDYHEHVRRSSLPTIHRYRAATQHLENFAAARAGSRFAHQISAPEFVRYLRTLEVSPNGHPHSAKRRLRDKGVRFVVEVCRSLYAFATRHRHLPPYQPNPFAELEPERMTIEDRKAVFVFNEQTELKFFQAADDWALPIHFTFAKTGLRPGELRHLLIEDLDLDSGWLHVRNKPTLGWRIKTGRERAVPLVPELVAMLRQVIGSRKAGPVFLRQQFRIEEAPLGAADGSTLEHACRERTRRWRDAGEGPPSREQHAKLARTVWRDTGAVRNEAIRQSFIRIAKTAGMAEATCPKSWRHSYATVVQDANVDPLIRQITLGHQPAGRGQGALGMTSTYTHTRPETQKQQIEQALRRWPASLALAAAWSSGPGGSGCCGRNAAAQVIADD